MSEQKPEKKEKKTKVKVNDPVKKLFSLEKAGVFLINFHRSKISDVFITGFRMLKTFPAVSI